MSETNIDVLAGRIHKTAAAHGFWDKGRNFGEMLMLATSELAEALEEHRNARPAVYWKCIECGYMQPGEPNLLKEVGHTIPRRGVLRSVLEFLRINEGIMCYGRMKPEGTAVEIADCIIRCLDTLQNLLKNSSRSPSDILALKMDYNDTRERMHGKAY